MFSWRSRSLFLESFSEKVQIFFLFSFSLGRGGKESVLYESKRFRLFYWLSSGVVFDRLFLWVFIFILSLSLSLYIYIYIYVCVCVCVCVSLMDASIDFDVWGPNNFQLFCLVYDLKPTIDLHICRQIMQTWDLEDELFGMTEEGFTSYLNARKC